MSNSSLLLLYAVANLAGFWHTGKASAQTRDSPGGLGYDSGLGARISAMWPLGQQQEGNSKYFVIWRGKPTAFPLYVEAGWNGGSVRPNEPNIRVRVRAFGEKGRPAGQINGPGASDDTFLTKKTCTFTPPKPGIYKLTLEWLDVSGHVLPQWDPKPKGRQMLSNDSTLARTMTLCVYQVPRPQAIVILGGWQAVPGETDLYKRSIGINWNNPRTTPPGYSYYVARTDVPKQRAVKLRVAPVFPVKGLDKVSWLSASVVNVNMMFGYQNDVATQFFRYFPLRDTPRDLDSYRVKVQVLP